MDLEQIKTIAQIISFLAVAATGIMGLLSYRSNARKEQQQREQGTYDALDNKYLDYQKLCLEYPRLDVADDPQGYAVTLTEEEKKQELIIFTMLFSIFERAFLMYRGHADDVRDKQWAGWDEYMGKFCKRANFVAAWKKSGATFDDDFNRFMYRRMGQSGVKLEPE